MYNAEVSIYQNLKLENLLFMIANCMFEKFAPSHIILTQKKFNVYVYGRHLI